MTSVRISAVLACHNEERFIQSWLEETSAYADEILLAVHAPTDATADIIADFKPHATVPIECVWFPAATVSRFGFSLMKNEMIARATGDWITSIDADEKIGFNGEELRQAIETATSRGKSSIGLVWPEDADQPAQSPRRVSDRATGQRAYSTGSRVFRKIKIFRNHEGYWWQGWLHERIYRHAQPAGPHSLPSDRLLHHYSFLNESVAEWKAPLYAYLLCRIVDCPQLRFGTNAWWIDVVFRRNAAAFRANAKLFLARQHEWFPEVPRRAL